MYQPNAETDPYESTLLALKLGSKKCVDEKLEDSRNTKILARLGSSEKMGVVLYRMPVVTENLLNLHPFVGFPGKDGDGNLADYWLKHDEHGEVDDIKNEWAPKKYDCLAYVNWDISPKAKVGEMTVGRGAATSKRAAMDVTVKASKKTKDGPGITTKSAIFVE